MKKEKSELGLGEKLTKKEEKKFEWEKELVYKAVYLPVRFFKKEAYIHIDDYKEVIDKREKVVKGLEEKNKKLKEDLAFERTILDNVRAEYESLQNVIKKLKKDLAETQKIGESRRQECKQLRKQYQHSMGFSDFGGYEDDE